MNSPLFFLVIRNSRFGGMCRQKIILLLLPYFSSFFYSIGMPIVTLFFLLSGYGLCMSYTKKGRDYLNGFLHKRYSKILPAFISLTCIMVILTVLSGKSLNAQFWGFMKHGDTPLPYSWFIYAIIYTYASFYLSSLIGKTPQRTGLLLIGFNLLYIFITWRVGHWGNYWYVSIPTVNLGYYIALYEKRIERIIYKHTLTVYILAVLMVFVAIVAKVKMPALTSMTNVSWEMFWGLNFAFAGYLIIRALGTIKWKPLAWMGVISLEIYLIHGIPILYLSSITANAFISTLGDVVFIILVYTTSIFFAWLIHKFTSRH